MPVAHLAVHLLVLHTATIIPAAPFIARDSIAYMLSALYTLPVRLSVRLSVSHTGGSYN